MAHPKNERSFVIIKPDGVHRALIGDILSRIEKTGLKFAGMKMLIPTREQAAKHYGKDDAWCTKIGGLTIKNMEAANKTPTKTAVEYGKDILDGLLDFLTCSPVIAIVVEGNQAVGIVKKLVGGTEPLTCAVGTIRGDLTLDSYELANIDFRAVRNLIHCSDAVEEANREIPIWFQPEEIIDYKHVNERMLYDVNLDGILE